MPRKEECLDIRKLKKLNFNNKHYIYNYEF